MSLHFIKRNQFIRFQKIPPTSHTTSSPPPPPFQNECQLNRLVKNLRTVRFLNQISCVHSFRLSSSLFYDMFHFSPVSITFRMPQYSLLILIIVRNMYILEQNAEFLNVKGSGICSYRIPFKS